MLEKSADLYRQAPVVGALKPAIIPESLAFSDDQCELDGIDKLRSRIHRMRQLLDKVDDGELALSI